MNTENVSDNAPSPFSLLDDPAEWSGFGKEIAPQQWESHVVLQGMHCATCALTIEGALRQVAGVEQVEVSAAAQRARVVWRSDAVQPSRWMSAIVRSGYKVLPAQDAHLREIRRAEQRKALWRWLLAAFCMMQVMMYAWPSYRALPGDLSLEMETLLRWASWVICIPIIIYSCGPFFSGAWRDLRQGRISMDLPVALGMGITFVISSMGTFEPEGIFGKEVFFDSLSMFAAFLLAGRWLEVRLRERTSGALDAVLNRLPQSVLRQSSQSFESVNLRRVQVGDILRVLPGQAFPTDGVLIQGRTQADEALLTGESRPIAKEVGQELIAGSYNLSAAILMRVTALGEETRFSQIVNLMESALTQKPRLAQLADRVAAPFLLIVILLAAATAIYWWPQDPGRGLMYAAVVLIVTCPCALSLATPVAMLTAAGTLAKQGVLVRNLQALETLSALDSVVFDKTGTLTAEGIQVSDGKLEDSSLSAPWAWGLAQAVAQNSTHPVSQAVQKMELPQDGDWSGKILELEEHSGKGLRALVEMQSNEQKNEQRFWVRLGSRSFAGGDELKPDLGQAVYLAAENQDQDQDGLKPLQSLRLLLSLKLQEHLRPEAEEVVQSLKAQGLRVHLLSGDEEAAVERVANQLGLEPSFVQARSTPALKLAAIQKLQSAGEQVGMVGDGLNDGPVLAGANASFAFGHSAAALARARADVVILGSDLRQVQQVLAFSKKTMRIVRQNLWWAAAYNAISVPFAAVGLVPPWLAGLGMALSSLWVVLNAARLVRA